MNVRKKKAGSAYGACGVGWRAGQQLAWLTAKIAPLEWHVEVDFLAEVSVLEGHVARCRVPTNMATAVSNFDRLCLAFVSVEPYREICSTMRYDGRRGATA